MPTEIIVAVIIGCITLAGVLISNSKSQAVTAIVLDDWLRWKLFGEDKPRYVWR